MIKTPYFAIIFFILQVTTIFSFSNINSTIMFYYLLFSLIISVELLINSNLFAYYIIILIKGIIALIIYERTISISNGILAFSLMQIVYLYYNFSRLNIYIFFISTFLLILALFSALIIYFTTNQFSINNFLYYSLFIFIIINLIINRFMYINTNKKFTIYINNSIKFINFLQSIKFPIAIQILFILAFVPFINDFLVKTIFIIVIIMPSFIELKHYFLYRKKHSLKFEISWIFPVVYFSIVGAINYILHLDISKDLYHILITNMLGVVIPLAIFNISALFILLQMNYNKFNSTYLTKKILRSPFLIIFSFFPSIVLFFYIFSTGENIKYSFLFPTILILCFFSTFFLVIYFKTVLETNAMLRKLMTTVTFDDFEKYKENIISLNETNIDAILKIIQAVIKNNDIPRAKSTFYSLSFWINENINKIKYESTYYGDQINNKFNTFFNTINYELLSCNNIIIHNNYLNSIRDMIFKPFINSSNYNDYKILFLSLHEYLIKRLENKQEEFAKDVYKTLYYPCSSIFLGLKKNDNTFSRKDYNLFSFKKIFLESNIDKIINTAIEYRCTEFLKSINVFKTLFINRNLKNYYYYWDSKIKEIFVSTKFIIRIKNIYLLDNCNSFYPIKSEYDLFLKSTIESTDIIEYQCYNDIINYIIDEILEIYNYAISINRRFNDSDLELLWKECLFGAEKKDISTFILFYSFFTFILDKIFNKEYKKTNPDYGMIYKLFIRVLQIKEYNKNELIEIIMKNYLKLKEKYPNLAELEENKPVYEFIEKIDYVKMFKI